MGYHIQCGFIWTALHFLGGIFGLFVLGYGLYTWAGYGFSIGPDHSPGVRFSSNPTNPRMEHIIITPATKNHVSFQNNGLKTRPTIAESLIFDAQKPLGRREY